MDNNYYAVIMAGGGGTRLWPMSRKESPKQLLKIIEGKSLFRIAIDRLEGLFDADHIFVVTVEEQIEKLREHAPEIPLSNYLIEPMPKGTASVVGFAAVFLQKIDPQAVMAVLTADHVMEDVSNFQKLLQQAKLIADKDFLVTLGIDPTYPATGYGYIEVGDYIEQSKAQEVKQFKEKPDLATAQKYVDSGSFYWNSGMFIWSVNKILGEFKRQMPQLFAKLEEIQSRISDAGRIDSILDIWQTIQAETIDYGIMESASNVAVLPAHNLGWKDVGSWDSLLTILEADQSGNILIGDNIINIDSENIFIESTDAERLIAVIGLDDLIVVDHQNTLLICRKGESEKVRQVIKKLKEKDQTDYL